MRLPAALDSRQWETRRKISARIARGVAMSRSRVVRTGPSTEFSRGTTPRSDLLFSTASKTAPIVTCGNRPALFPKRSRAARCAKEPSGPRQATLRGAWSARDEEKISHQSFSRASAESGPSLRAAMSSRTLRSCTGSNTPIPALALTRPISTERRARSLRSLTSSRSLPRMARRMASTSFRFMSASPRSSPSPVRAARRR